MNSKIKQQRDWMKSRFFEDKDKSDQELQLPQPPLQKSYDRNDELIDLPDFNENILEKKNIYSIIRERVSHRKYSDESLSLEELSFLLWSTQGVKEIKGKNYATMRTVPSAGARHPFETYIAVNRVEGLRNGVYRYLALSHQLVYIFKGDNLEESLTIMTLGQKFVGRSAVTFIWSAMPYRGEWRYSTLSHKVMLLDAGHVCQNLYLACEAIGCGTCAIAAYNQDECDKFLGLNGKDEFVIYLSPVGKV